MTFTEKRVVSFNGYIFGVSVDAMRAELMDSFLIHGLFLVKKSSVSSGSKITTPLYSILRCGFCGFFSRHPALFQANLSFHKKIIYLRQADKLV